MLGTLGLWAGAARGRGSAAGPVAAGPRAVLGARGGGGYAGLASCGCDRGLVGPAPRAPRFTRLPNLAGSRAAMEHCSPCLRRSQQ